MARLKVNGGEVWHKNYQGAGTGMDADTVDLAHAAALLPSDERLKEDIKPPPSMLEAPDIAKLIVAYKYKPFNGSEQPQRYGVIAQRLLEHPDLKGLVRTSGGDPDTHLAIDPYSVLFYLASSLAVAVASLEERLALLEGPNT